VEDKDKILSILVSNP